MKTTKQGLAKHDEDMSMAIRLFRDIYYHTLGQSGDRSSFPCPQIEEYLLGFGIDLRGEE